MVYFIQMGRETKRRDEMMHRPMPEMLSSEEAARYLGISPEYLTELRERELLSPRKAGDSFIYYTADLDMLMGFSRR
jgi:hypothetical protein